MRAYTDELSKLRNHFGTYEVARVLGDYKSYILLRADHSYSTIFKEMDNLCKE
jgi:hypothetical protein